MKLLKLLTLLTTTLGILGAHEAEIRLVDSIAVRAPTITLGEIAQVQCEDEALRERLIHLELSKAPKIGAKKILSSYRIRSLLEKEGLEDVIVHGMESSVTTETITLNDTAIQEIVREWIEDKVGNGSDYELTFSRVDKEWEVPHSEEITYSIMGAKTAFTGNKTLSIRAAVGNKVLAQTRVQVKLEQYKNAYVVTRPILRGEEITYDHVEERRTLVTRTNGMEIASVDQVIGKVAKRNLKVGDVPRMNDFDRKVIVERGSYNKVIVINGTVKMAIAGARALQDGKEGDLIQFSNPVNKRQTLTARVKRAGLAVIKLN